MSSHAEEAWDDLLFGRGELGGVYAYGPDYPSSIRCRHCGSGPFEWENFGTLTDPVWRLVDDDGNRHVCPPPDPRILFEDIS